MYANVVKPVEMPTEGGRTLVLKNGYVYWITRSAWDSERKRSVDDRVCIGKIVPDRPGWMYPNEKFSRLFNDAAKDSGGTFSGTAKRGRFHTHLNFGVFFLLKQGAMLSGCHEALVGTFPGKTADQIFAVAMHAIDANCEFQDFPGWSFDNYCGLGRPLADREMDALCTSLAQSPEDLAAFWKSLGEARLAAGLDAPACDEANGIPRDKTADRTGWLRSHFALDEAGAQLEETFGGRMFVARVALVLVEAVRRGLEDFFRTRPLETMGSVMSEMRLYKIRMSNPGEWQPIYAPTAKQKSILKSLGSSAADLENAARAVSLRV